AGAARPCLEMLLVAVVDQRVEPVHGLDHDVAAASTVATGRPAEFDELLAPERDACVTAVAGSDVDLGLVVELHDRRIGVWASAVTCHRPMAGGSAPAGKARGTVALDAGQKIDLPG